MGGPRGDGKHAIVHQVQIPTLPGNCGSWQRLDSYSDPTSSYHCDQSRHMRSHPHAPFFRVSVGYGLDPCQPKVIHTLVLPDVESSGVIYSFPNENDFPTAPVARSLGSYPRGGRLYMKPTSGPSDPPTQSQNPPLPLAPHFEQMAWEGIGTWTLCWGAELFASFLLKNTSCLLQDLNANPSRLPFTPPLAPCPPCHSHPQNCPPPPACPEGPEGGGGTPRVLASPLQAILAPSKSQNALKMGCFATNNGSKMGQKCVFPKILLDYLGCTNKWNEPILSPC